MPWNDQSNGGRGPWGQPPRGGPQRGGDQPPPDLEDVIRNLQSRMGGVFGGGGGGSRGGRRGGGAGLFVVLALAILVWIGWPKSGWYIVEPEQQGVILRFGQYTTTTPPGFHFKLPYPIEQVLLPAVTTIHNTDIGFVSPVGGRGGRDVPDESLMLTSDENIVDIDFTVQWRIDLREARGDGVRDFLFNVRDPEATVKAVAESAMREVVGATELEPIITRGRTVVAERVVEVIQTTLDDYEIGIQVLEVQLQKADPPENVIEAFRAVDAAAQVAERLALDATAFSNQVIPEAQGDAARLRQEAEGYRDSVIAEAQGDADRFVAIYDEYASAPEVTRRRMYLETMERVISNSDLIIMEGEAGVVPYLPLDQVDRRRAGARPSSNQGGEQ